MGNSPSAASLVSPTPFNGPLLDAGQRAWCSATRRFIGSKQGQQRKALISQENGALFSEMSSRIRLTASGATPSQFVRVRELEPFSANSQVEKRPPGTLVSRAAVGFKLIRFRKLLRG
jgi:hypothetical protein